MVFIICILLLSALLGIAFKITGAVLAAFFWILKFPIVLFLWLLGGLCCCTILLIPVGMGLFRAGTAVLL